MSRNAKAVICGEELDILNTSAVKEKGKTMKWLRKHKQVIIYGIQSILVIYTMTIGFCITYQSIWIDIGLPLKWWSIVISMALGLLSVFGTCAWIVKGEQQ